VGLRFCVCLLVERERGGGEERVYAGVSVPVDCVCVWCVGKRVRVRDGRIPMERGGDAARHQDRDLSQ
jgi:hypothetical protein